VLQFVFVLFFKYVLFFPFFFFCWNKQSFIRDKIYLQWFPNGITPQVNYSKPWTSAHVHWGREQIEAVSATERIKRKGQGGNNNYLLRARKLAAMITGFLHCQYSWLEPCSVSPAPAVNDNRISSQLPQTAHATYSVEVGTGRASQQNAISRIHCWEVAHSDGMSTEKQWRASTNLALKRISSEQG